MKPPAIQWLAFTTLLLLGTTRVLSQCVVTVAGPVDVRGAPATATQIFQPYGLAPDGSGGLYVADSVAYTLRRVFPNGTMSIAAGIIKGFGSGGNGGPGSLARNGYIMNLASDGAGGVYVADRSFFTIRRVFANGTITLVAGSTSGSAGDGGAATLAQLAATYGAAPDLAPPMGNGGLFIADTGNNVIRCDWLCARYLWVMFLRSWLSFCSSLACLFASPRTLCRYVWPNATITRLAGNGSAGYSGDSGAGLRGQLNAPYHVISDGAGGAWIAEFGNHVVRRLSVNGLLSTLSGNGTAAYTGDSGPASLATLNSPTSIASDSSGNLFIAVRGHAGSELRRANRGISCSYSCEFPHYPGIAASG